MAAGGEGNAAPTDGALLQPYSHLTGVAASVVVRAALRGGGGEEQLAFAL